MPRAIVDASTTHNDEDRSPESPTRFRSVNTTSSKETRSANAAASDETHETHPPSQTIRVDFLVIGSGISGLSYALEASKNGRVAIVTKDAAYEGSTHYAQGGISAVIAQNDTVEAHVLDTNVAGDFLCDPSAVDVVCREGPAAVKRLVDFGTQFTRSENGELHLAREGGHSEKRIVHADDMTGKEVERALLQSAVASANITFYEHHLVRDLVTSSTVVCDRDGTEVSCDEVTRCVGAEVTRRRDGARLTFLAPCTLLAAGGAGQLFPSTTNPSVSTGDGVAMAVRAGACVANMEFYQFHPTSLYTGVGGAKKRKNDENAFLVTEAVRGHGGRLFDAPTGGTRFMEKYDTRMELAPRDVVARAIDREITAAVGANKKAACVWLDVTHLDGAETLKNFPGIAKELLLRGIDITKQRVPITPAAHYLCGGVSTDLNGQTTVEGLFACGENAYTGVHGANRLASNSLLEAAVFANRAVFASVERLELFGEQLAPTLDAVQASVERNERELLAAQRKRSRGIERHEGDDPMDKQSEEPKQFAFDDEQVWTRKIREKTQAVMWSAAGIVRETESLLAAELELEQLLRTCEFEMMRSFNGGGLRGFEVRNLLVTGLCVLRSAASRKESRGLHYVLDHPVKVETERRPTLVTPKDTEKYGRAPVISLVAKMNDDVDEAVIVSAGGAGAPAR